MPDRTDKLEAIADRRHDPSPGDALAVAQAIRDELKRRHGWSRYHVSVRAHGSGIDERICCSVRAPGVSVRRVEHLARRFQRLRRDEHSGDLLEGGNRIVSVSLHWELPRPFLPPLRERLEALAPLGFATRHELRFGRYAFFLFRREGSHPAAFYFEGSDLAFDSQGAAAQIARTLVQSRHWRRLLAELTS